MKALSFDQRRRFGLDKMAALCFILVRRLSEIPPELRRPSQDYKAYTYHDLFNFLQIYTSAFFGEALLVSHAQCSSPS